MLSIGWIYSGFHGACSHFGPLIAEYVSERGVVWSKTVVIGNLLVWRSIITLLNIATLSFLTPMFEVEVDKMAG